MFLLMKPVSWVRKANQNARNGDFRKTWNVLRLCVTTEKAPKTKLICFSAKFKMIEPNKWKNAFLNIGMYRLQY